MTARKTKTVYGIEFVYLDKDNNLTSRALGEDLYEDREDAEARVLAMNHNVVRPHAGRKFPDADYYEICDYTVIPKTFKEWP